MPEDKKNEEEYELEPRRRIARLEVVDDPRQEMPADHYNKQKENDMIKDKDVKKGPRSMVVTIINNMPFIQTAFFESATSLLFETSKTTQLAWMNAKTFPVDFARNWAVKRFLNNKKYETIEWMGWLDIDMTFPKNGFNIMLDAAEETGAKVMTGIYFKKNMERNEIVTWKYDHLNRVVEPCLDGTVQEIEIMGMGFCIIHRSVLEKIGYPWFKYGPLHEDLTLLSTEDIQFCERCKEEGIKIWAHTGVICGHLMTIENINNQISVVSPTNEPIKGRLA